MTLVRIVVITLALLAIPRTARAAEPEDEDNGRKVIYNSRTEIDFEEVEVDGQLVKPEGTLLLDRKRATFNPLIKLRRNWDAEITESLEEVN
jgi:hypothetical protein